MFLAPSMLWLGVLGLIPVVLYLVRPRPRDGRITTLPFFLQLAREHQESNWLRRLKRLLSLLLTLLVIAALVLTLARWVLAPAPGEVRNVVLLFDTSASMAARQDPDPDRLAEAVGRARVLLDGLPDSIPVSVVAYDSRIQVLAPATRNPLEVDLALDRLVVRPVAGDRPKALELSRQLAAMETPAEIWHFTDTLPEGVSSPADDEGNEVTVRDFNLALPAARNAGITAFSLRRLPLDRRSYEAFVQIQGSGFEAEAEAELVASLDGEALSVRKLVLRPEEPVHLTLPFGGTRQRILKLELRLAGDCLALDNVLFAHIPEAKPITVAWLAREPGPFTQTALQALATDGDLVIKAGGATWPVEEAVDFAIFDGWVPDPWPADLPVALLNPPPCDRGPLLAAPITGGGLPLLGVRVGNPDHPVLFGVDSARVAPLQTAVMVNRGGLEPLWLGPSGAVLAAGEYEGQRISILAANPDRSEKLPLTTALPLLLGNMIYWGAQGELEASMGSNLAAGETLPVGPGEAPLLWFEPESGLAGATPLERRETGGPTSAEGGLVELDATGIWRTAPSSTGDTCTGGIGSTPLRG